MYFTWRISCHAKLQPMRQTCLDATHDGFPLAGDAVNVLQESCSEAEQAGPLRLTQPGRFLHVCQLIAPQLTLQADRWCLCYTAVLRQPSVSLCEPHSTCL